MIKHTSFYQLKILRTMAIKRASNIITLVGAFGFVSVVLYLQFVQDEYSPANQLMSELALGIQGSFMLYAFLFIALSIAGATSVLASYQASVTIKTLLGTASLSFVGAGIFKLGAATTIHVGLVGLAFMLLGLVMYLVPRYVDAYQHMRAKIVCWGLCSGTAVAAALGSNVLPIGIGQRIAAGFILLWLCWLAIFTPNQESIPGA